MSLRNSDCSKVVGRKTQWERYDVTSKVVDFEQAREEQSQRQFAKQKGVARSTLQYWLARKASIDDSPAVVDFMESPDGITFLHRLVTAAHFVFTKDGVASIHNVSTFLEISGLGVFVGSSYSTQRRISNRMDDLIIEFEKVEQPKLIQNMPIKKISLAEDETFHPQICMVSIEPVSNYIVVEKYVQRRDAETWNAVLNESLRGLPVEVIQVASDEARGLISHTIKGLNAHHSSDCFHVSHEIGKGTSGALAAAIRKAEKEYACAVKVTEKEKINKERYAAKQPKLTPDHPSNFEEKVALAEKREAQAKSALDIARQKQETVRTAKAEIGKVYHPYNTETGAKQDSQKVSQLLEACFEDIQRGTKDLSERCTQRIEKAHRVVENMVATIAFFFNMIELYMDNMHMSDFDRRLMHDYLIPGYYLQEASRKEKDKERKSRILEKSQKLLSVVMEQDGPFCSHSETDIKKLQKAAEECAKIFQRSSSCVEGRNAQLSLRHHGIHRLSDRSLKAQTIVHNYYTKRKNGTTPAENFFEAKHSNLFAWLLEHMDYPTRPRKRVKKVA